MPFCFLPRYLLSPGALYVPWELKKCAQPGLLASSYLNPSLQTTDERERVKWNDKQFIQWFKEAQMYIWFTVEKGRWDETQDVDLMWAIPERAAAISVKLSSHGERKDTRTNSVLWEWGKSGVQRWAKVTYWSTQKIGSFQLRRELAWAWITGESQVQGEKKQIRIKCKARS